MIANFCWRKNNMEKKSIRSTVNHNRDLWKQVWHLKLPPKLSIFLWKFLNDRLPCTTNISKRIHSFSDACIFCGEPESQIHIFFKCSKAAQIWLMSSFILLSFLLLGASVYDYWTILSSDLNVRNDNHHPWS